MCPLSACRRHTVNHSAAAAPAAGKHAGSQVPGQRRCPERHTPFLKPLSCFRERIADRRAHLEGHGVKGKDPGVELGGVAVRGKCCIHRAIPQRQPGALPVLRGVEGDGAQLAEGHRGGQGLRGRGELVPAGGQVQRAHPTRSALNLSIHVPDLSVDGCPGRAQGAARDRTRIVRGQHGSQESRQGRRNLSLPIINSGTCIVERAAMTQGGSMSVTSHTRHLPGSTHKRVQWSCGNSPDTCSHGLQCKQYTEGDVNRKLQSAKASLAHATG